MENLYTQLLLMGLLLSLSAVFSGSETAFFSLSTADLNRLRRQTGPVARAILGLHANLGDFLMTVLFCNMLVNILFYAISAVMAAEIASRFGPEWAIPFGLGCLLVVITLGEITPKTMATVARVFFCQLMAIPLYTVHRVLFVVRRGLGLFVHAIERMIGLGTPATNVNPAELRLLVQAGRAEGLISSQEHELISEVLELPQVRVREMMTPRVDVRAIGEDATVNELLYLARATGHSKLPVRCSETGEFTGWVDAREIFLDDPDGAITSYIHRPLYLSELDRGEHALQQLRESRARLAIVVDERGATEGILTLPDVLAEIFGTLGDEGPPQQDPVQEDGENAYILSGDLSVREWRNLFGVAHELPGTATVGGLLTALLGRPPLVGDKVRLGNLNMEAVQVTRRRVRMIRITLEPGASKSPSSSSQQLPAEGDD